MFVGIRGCDWARRRRKPTISMKEERENAANDNMQVRFWQSVFASGVRMRRHAEMQKRKNAFSGPSRGLEASLPEKYVKFGIQVDFYLLCRFLR